MINSKSITRLALVLGAVIAVLGAIATVGVFAANETADAAAACQVV